MGFHRADACNMAEKISLRRLWNAAKVGVSYGLTRLTGRPIQWGLPIAVSIEPTTACNLRCPECPSGRRAFSRATGHLSLSLFQKTIDQLYRDTFSLYLYFQGEPYLHPGFFELVHYAHRRGLFTTTSTNGHFLDAERARRTVEAGLDRLIVSLDGITQEAYAQYRVGGRLARVQQGIQELAHWKRRLRSRRPHLIAQCIVWRSNEYQLEEVKRLARQWGADEVWFKRAQVYDYRQGHPLLPTQPHYSRYIQHPDGYWALKHPLPNHCWRLWYSCVITWDGIVVPCCFDKDATHQLGDLKTTPFSDIWRGAAYRRFRQRLLKGRKEIDICTNCTEGCSVWI